MCSHAVRQLALAPDGIVVVHDDLEREFGKLALKKGGSAGYAWPPATTKNSMPCLVLMRGQGVAVVVQGPQRCAVDH